MRADRERWNARWRDRSDELEPEARVLAEHASLLPTAGTALDVAGGAGRNAIWLARRGLDVTLVDISDVALATAERRAARAGVAQRMRFVIADLEEPLPVRAGFDVVLVFHYLDRARRDDFVRVLAAGGVLIAAQPTVVNLERHAKPGRDYLVELGELESWVRALDLHVLATHEGWTDEGRHEAMVVATKLLGSPA